MRGRRFSRTIPTHLRAIPGRCSSFPQDSLSPPQIWMRIAGFGRSPTPCGGNADRYERLSFVPFSNFPLTRWAPLSTVCAFVSSSKISPLLIFYLEVTSLGLVNNDRDNSNLRPRPVGRDPRGFQSQGMEVTALHSLSLPVGIHFWKLECGRLGKRSEVDCGIDGGVFYTLEYIDINYNSP